MFHNTKDDLSGEKCIANLRLFIVLYCFVLVFFLFPQVGSSSVRLIEIQGELKRLQAISPSSDPTEAEGQAASR